MTSTRAVLPQPVPMPAGSMQRLAGDAKGQSAAAGLPQPEQEFAALFSMLTGGGAIVPDGAVAEQGEGAAEELLPRRAGPDKGKSRELRPEDVFPPELLATLYSQMSKPVAGMEMPARSAPIGEAITPEMEAQILAAIAPRSAPAAPSSGDLPPVDTAAVVAPSPSVVRQQPPTPASFVAALALASALTPARTMPAPEPATPTATPAPAPLPAPVAAAPAAAQAAASPVLQQAIAAAAPRPDQPAVSKAAFTPQPPAGQRSAADASADPRTPAAPAEVIPFAAARPERAERQPLLLEDTLRKADFTVTRQETILPPAAAPGQMPVAHQAAEKIIADLQSPDGPAQPSAANLAREAATPAPVRVLHLQLQPQELGTLTVKLSLKGSGLDVKLEAAEPHTLRILEADRDRLTDILRGAGYSIDALAVLPPSDKAAANFQAFNGASPDTASSSGGGAQQQGQSQTGGAQSDAQRGHGSRAAPDQGGASGANGEEGKLSHRARNSDGDIYI